jgi:hypothetical protein
VGSQTKAKPQIGCYMSSKEADRVSKYARKLGVKRPLLGFLLVLRELNCHRLPTLRDRYPYPGKKKGRGRVTARLSTKALKTVLEKHIHRYGIGSDEAAWILFQAELAEKWMEKSLHKGNQG